MLEQLIHLTQSICLGHIVMSTLQRAEMILPVTNSTLVHESELVSEFLTALVIIHWIVAHDLERSSPDGYIKYFLI